MLDYLKVFPDIEVLLKRYDDAQRGRLFMAMMAYAYRGELPTFGENTPEWYVWDMLQFKIDQCAESLEAKKASGKKGGSAKQPEADESNVKQTEANASTLKQSQAKSSKAKQPEADESNVKQTEANASTLKQSQAKSSKAKQPEADESNVKQNAYIQEQEQVKEQVKEQEKNSGGGYVTPTPYDDLTDDELRRMREEQADVEAAAKRMGLPASASGDFDAMDRLRTEYGAENLLKAINKTQGATEKSRCWRYVEGILRKEKERGYTWTDKPPDSKGGMSYERRPEPRSHTRDL
jgi:hypothetical protein